MNSETDRSGMDTETGRAANMRWIKMTWRNKKLSSHPSAAHPRLHLSLSICLRRGIASGPAGLGFGVCGRRSRCWIKR
jgi:hypothetical protein